MIYVQKGHSQLRLREVGRFNFCKQFLLLQCLFTFHPRTKIKYSIPTEWRSLIKTSVDVTIADFIQSIPTIKMISDNEVSILDISPKRDLSNISHKSRPLVNRI